MVIEWGSFYFRAEGTVAVLLGAAPVLFVMTLPSVAEAIKRTVYLLTRSSKKKLTLLDRIRRAEKEAKENE